MKAKIIEYLDGLEKEKDIKILLACETGSRAWGFPSPNSDFDIRMIYVHKKDWYLSIAEKTDSIERMLDNNDIDITGWDLRKSLRLLQKSNAALLERIQSPILYKYDEHFLEGITALAAAKYSRIATIHHYLSMAKNFLHDLRDAETYKLKSFFYALRTATTCLWIIEKEVCPPIEFVKLIEGLNLDKKLTGRIHELIALKATVEEKYMHTGEKELITFMDNCLEKAAEEKNSLPAAKGKLVDMDTFFRETISTHDH